ncbi:Alkaline phosphatase synthesis sensor protein PhoR [Planctomycetes bacterium Poly30]|uniref:histidine kinase n=1 Tax=Saltatorellus ferox TaxID=2528018 RepID=A0A518EMQ4_9BACT|nr:Alkaline phosphatase synthesis sensor protein PhoR [Planctomycetes bacterium Poly30]
MKRDQLKTLYLFAGGVLLVALAAVSVLVVHETRAHARTTAEALFHEDVRTALWRMETRVGSMVATTTMRGGDAVPASDYSNRWIAPKDNALNDEAAPTGSLRSEIVEAADDAFVMACGLAETGPLQEAVTTPDPALSGAAESRGWRRSQEEYLARQASTNVTHVVSANRDVEGAGSWTMGPLAPVWCGTDAARELYLARRVEAGGGVRHESYRIPWPELEALLLAEIADLFPDARLVPLTGPLATQVLDPARDVPTEDDAFRLAAIPVRLEASPGSKVRVAMTPFAILGAGWASLLAGLGMGWFALRSSVAYGDKHRRFTHAVTHELRTPLTTFRMYSEMLARGMVPEESRPEYLATLESESLRLSGLVENVLRYAQLEEGAGDVRRETLDGAELMRRIEPELSGICARAGAGFELELGVGSEAPCSTDPQAIAQILMNLVENACKYGFRGSEAAKVRVWAHGDRGHLLVDVIDEGPGVPGPMGARVFEPFERAGRDSSDRAPGVGLGLALSRDLARSLGGDLTLESGSRGATFRLRV